MVAIKYKGVRLTRTKVRNNILRVYTRAPDEFKSDWYGEANEFAGELALEFDVPKLKVCGVIAALSPRKSWASNKVEALNMLATGDCGHMALFKGKAAAILEGAETEYEILSILNGEKIKSFYINIAHPLRYSHVTIDRHALSIALRRKTAEKDYSNMTKTQYDFFVSAYKSAGKLIDKPAHFVQSTTWQAFRNNKNIIK